MAELIESGVDCIELFNFLPPFLHLFMKKMAEEDGCLVASIRKICTNIFRIADIFDLFIYLFIALCKIL